MENGYRNYSHLSSGYNQKITGFGLVEQVLIFKRAVICPTTII